MIMIMIVIGTFDICDICTYLLIRCALWRPTAVGKQGTANDRMTADPVHTHIVHTETCWRDGENQFLCVCSGLYTHTHTHSRGREQRERGTRKREEEVDFNSYR
jgi:hypothetical protein